MPHDSKGQALQAGDRVTLQADVLRVFRDSPDNDSGNVEMQIVGGASFQVGGQVHRIPSATVRRQE
jgi:hypothetical protein